MSTATRGRVITAEYRTSTWCAATLQTPRISWPGWTTAWPGRTDIRDYLLDLDAKKPVVYCGDLNVAHQEIDIKNPGPNRRNPRLYRRGAGEDDEAPLQRLCGHVPVSVPGQDRGLLLVELPLQCPEEQRRWRIDYFIVSERLKDKIRNADIWSEVLGSDHCPVVLDLDV